MIDNIDNAEADATATQIFARLDLERTAQFGPRA